MDKRVRNYHITIYNSGDIIKVRGDDDVDGFLRSIVGGNNSNNNIVLSMANGISI